MSKTDARFMVVGILIAILYVLVLTGCGTRPALKFAAGGIVADMASTEYAIAQPGISEGNSIVSARPTRIGMNAALGWGLYEWSKRDLPDWPLWTIGALRFIVAGYNVYMGVR